MREIAISCSYIPQELITVAKCKPSRHITPLVENCGCRESREFPSYLCSFALSYLNNILEANNILAVVFTNSCHAMENVYEMLKIKRPHLPSIFINVPRERNKNAIKYFYHELNLLRKFIQDVSGYTITDDDLMMEIKKYTEYYAYYGNIEQLPEESIVDKSNDNSKKDLNSFEDNSDLFEKLIDNLVKEKKHGISCPSKRIIVSGSVRSPLNIISVVEEYGGKVVYCDTCDLGRILPVFEDGSNDPIQILAKAYIEKTPCPRMLPEKKKYEQIEKLIKICKADGIIYSLISFCPDQTFYVAEVSAYLKSIGLPFLVLDNEFALRCSGQIQTRIQAFLEIL